MKMHGIMLLISLRVKGWQGAWSEDVCAGVDCALYFIFSFLKKSFIDSFMHLIAPISLLERLHVCMTSLNFSTVPTRP